MCCTLSMYCNPCVLYICVSCYSSVESMSSHVVFECVYYSCLELNQDISEDIRILVSIV